MTEIKDDIDVAILALPASKVLGALKPVENVKGAIIVSAGFKEARDSWRRLEEESFDDVNTRLTEKKPVMNLVGFFKKEDAEEMRTVIKEMREKSSDRTLRITNSLKNAS